VKRTGKKRSLGQRGAGPAQMRPMSGAVRGPASRGQQQYTLRANETYAAPLTQSGQSNMKNISQRQSTGAWGKNIQILTPENVREEQR